MSQAQAQQMTPQEELFATVFFQKVAADGIVPADEHEATLMLATAGNLLAKHAHDEARRAQSQKAVASSRIEKMARLAGVPVDNARAADSAAAEAADFISQYPGLVDLFGG